MQELDHYINKVQNLPPAPKIVPELLRLLGQPDIDSHRIVRLITYDPALTAKILQLCNSAFFSGSNPATTLDEAITRLGFNQVFAIVAAVSGAKALGQKQEGYGLHEGELWNHSVTTGVAAQLIAKHVGVDPNLAFTAGLLHDIGKIVLSEALEHIYTKLIQQVEEKQTSLLETEKNLLGAQHAEVGGRLLARWLFPPNIVAAVWFHHAPMAAQPHHKLASIVYLANMIAYFIGHGYGHSPFALRGRKESLDILQLRGDDLPYFMIQTYETFFLIESLINAGN